MAIDDMVIQSYNLALSVPLQDCAAYVQTVGLSFFDGMINFVKDSYDYVKTVSREIPKINQALRDSGVLLPEMKDHLDWKPYDSWLGPIRHFYGGLILRCALEKSYLAYEKARSFVKHSAENAAHTVLSNPMWIALFANLPDADFFLGLPHRGPTHSLAFAGLVGLSTMGAYAFSRKKDYVCAAGLFAAGMVASHVLVDYFIEGWSTSIGYPFQKMHGSKLHEGDSTLLTLYFTAGSLFAWHYYDMSSRINRTYNGVVNCLSKAFGKIRGEDWKKGCETKQGSADKE